MRRSISAGALFLCLAVSGTASAQQATVINLSPPSPGAAPTEQSLTIMGAGFKPALSVVFVSPSGSTVTVGGRSITKNTPTALVVSVVLPTSGSWAVRVTNPASRTSKDWRFVVRPAGAVAIPVFTPAAGACPLPQSVAITCGTAGATIRYSLDGSTPTGSFPIYRGPIPVTSGMTIKAVASKAGLSDSNVASAAYRCTEPAISSLKVVDGNATSRFSATKLQMVLSSGMTRTAKATANASGTWTANGKQIGTGTSVSYSASLGTTAMACTNTTSSALAAVEIVAEARKTTEVGFKNAKVLADVLSRINSAFGLSEDTIQWSVKGSYTSWNVDKRSTPQYGTSKKLTVSGGAALKSPRVFIPGYSVTLPFVRAGAFVEPSLSLMMAFSAEKNASTAPETWVFSGGPKLSGAIAGGLGAFVGERNVVRIDADVRGSVGASGTAKLQGPPVRINLAYAIGQLRVGGQVKIYVLGKPRITQSVSQTVWSGLNGTTNVPLSNEIQ